MDNYLNKINTNIQFTLEIQLNNKINLLNLIVSIYNNKFEFNIYRRPPQTDTIIPYDSNHPYTQNISFFNLMFYRLEKIPLNSFNHQQEFIHEIAYKKKKNVEISVNNKIHKRIK